MHYDIEADWILLQTCNYRCNYCFAPPETLGEKLATYGTPQQWRDAFDATGRTWLLHITGGEPSIYPKFVDLCEALSARHFLSLNSNLTHASVADFAMRIDPSRVMFINAGFHIDERDRRSGHASFLANAKALQERGHKLLVSLVATPSALARYDDAVAILSPLGLVPIPKLFRGVDQGRLYPDFYTPDEKDAFVRQADMARRCYADLIDAMPERPTLDIFRDSEFLDGEPRFTGQACDAGSRFARIEPNGDVNRCGPPFLGNLLDGSFAPMPAAAPCDTQFCYYFCKKYTDTAREAAAQLPPIARPSLLQRMFAGSWGRA